MEPLEILSHLAQAEEGELMALAQRVRPQLGPLHTVREGPRLLPLPFRDGRRGGTFLLGEALVYEAWLRATRLGLEGYGAVLGPHPRRARALALLDLALQGGLEEEAIREAAQRAAQARAEAEGRLLRLVERTRLEVETL